ncbi:unnamed protein product [Urochloa decumbens]|uniref:Knottin scorpion toxin-like domain-containing protein n=1 Tax=Urochloa decumbens TaxID=240449 RepID=A0ABC8WBS3_9POAL
MELSPRKNLSAATAVVLLLVILAPDSLKSFVDGCHDHLSSSYRGVCWPFFNGDKCSRACIAESSDNFSGSCDLFQCWCYNLKCHYENVAPRT